MCQLTTILDHDVAFSAINRRKIETDVVENVDPTLSALREHVVSSTGRRRSEMTTSLKSIRNRALRLTIHMGDWTELDLSTTVKHKVRYGLSGLSKSDMDQEPSDVCSWARPTITFTMPMLEAMHATERTTQFDTYSDLLRSTFKCIKPCQRRLHWYIANQQNNMSRDLATREQPTQNSEPRGGAGRLIKVAKYAYP